MKHYLLIAACLLVTACTTTDVRKLDAGPAPAQGARILLVEPRIRLGLLTAGGVTEPREDWSQQAETHIQTHIRTRMTADRHSFSQGRLDELMEGRLGQVVRLNDAVIAALLDHEYRGYLGATRLPTKADGFDWTIGEGAQLVAQQFNADYALFVSGQGTYASGGRIAAFVVASALGVGIPLGEQRVMASLVDLRTGQVVWANYATAGSGADMRDEEGAAALVNSLLKDVPLGTGHDPD